MQSLKNLQKSENIFTVIFELTVDIFSQVKICNHNFLDKGKRRDIITFIYI